ncbi:MAG: O-antigen ligase family protein, partial [Acidobacteriota bacterium]
MRKSAGLPDRLAFGTLLALLVLTPWPLGSRLPWASMLAAGVTIAMGSLWLAAALLTGRRLIWHSLYLPIIAFLAWTGLQWAAGWTIYAHATAYEWVRYFSYAAAFALTVQVARQPERADLLRTVIMMMAIAVGLFGLLQFLTWNGHLYWIYDPPYLGTRFGPFNNRNYFAGYMVASLAPALASIFSGEKRRDRVLIGYLTWVAVLSLLICLSRGGSIALAVVLGMVIAYRLDDLRSIRNPLRREGSGNHRNRGRALLAVAVVVSIIAGLAWLQQTDRVLARLETLFQFEAETPLQGRARIWHDALPMVADRPLAGFGLNTFGWAFPQYRHEPTSNTAMHAHNEYLEMLV